jgi:CheY-like chemotaxis protein
MSKNSEKILVVEDDHQLAILLEIILGKAGYETNIVGNGKDALKIYQEWSPDLILLDVMLPEMDGFEICKAIRNKPTYSYVPIIMVTAMNSYIDKEKGFSAGADDYVTKPFKNEELLLRVKSHLSRVQKLLALSRSVLTTGNLQSNIIGTAPQYKDDLPLHKHVDNPTVSVIVPTLNEADCLPYVLPRIPTWVDEVLLVDGRSEDNTIEVARQIMPSIRIVTQKGKGKGDALRYGFEHAKGDIIIAIDADGSTDPTEIPAFVGTLLSGADYAKGTRFSQGAGTSDMPLYRKMGNLAFVIIVRILFGGSYTDLLYGYNAMWKSVVPYLELDADGFEIETQMNIRALRAKLKITEVASFEAERIAGQAKLVAIPDGFRVLKQVLGEYYQMLQRRRRRTIRIGTMIRAFLGSFFLK